MTAEAFVPDYGPNRLTLERDREFTSHECRRADHKPCQGYYDTHGSAIGYDTYQCFCACHKPRDQRMADQP